MISRIRRSGGCIECGRRTRRSRGSSTTDGVRHAPHHVAGSGARSIEARSIKAGMPCAMRRSNEATAGCHPVGCGAHAATGRAARVGLALGRREDAVRTADGGLRRVPGEHRLNIGRLLDSIEAMGDHDNTLVIYSSVTTARAWRGRSPAPSMRLTMQNGIVLTSEQQLPLSSSMAGLTPGERTSSHHTTRLRGRGPGTHRSSGASNAPPTSAAHATAWCSRGRNGSTRG